MAGCSSCTLLSPSPLQSSSQFLPHALALQCCLKFAWRFRIPDDLLFRASNNLLEFLAAIVTLWVDIINGCLSSGDCALSMTDGTMAEGWMRKSNFSKYGVDPVQARTQVNAARKYAKIFMIADVKSYSQWFLGKRNNVRTLSLGSGKGLTMNSPKFFAPFSQIRCQTVSRYYHSPARSAPG